MSKRIQTYDAPGIRVTFDPNLCRHSARCLRAEPAVFDVSRARWIRPELATAGAVAAAIEQCPSGALQYTLTSEPAAGEPQS
ncbi:MAG: (4Fe-4S)-binding protein [Vicinamibacterales bacterium]